MSVNLILLFVFLVFSGFFSSAETALFSISKVKALHLAKNGKKVDMLILKMKEDSHTLLTTILIGNNVVNIGASSLATAIAMNYFSSNAVGIATGTMTFLILIFGEIFPKSFATYNNILVARSAIFPIFWLSKLFIPLIVFLNFIPKILGTFDKLPAVTEDELMTMVEVVEEDGEIKEEEKQLISNIFDFDDTSSSEIMTPRTDMFVIDVDEELNIKFILRSGFTRIPVIDGAIDNIVGILNVKDLFAKFHDNSLDGSCELVKTTDVMKAPYFVPESKKLDSLLREFKNMKNHIGIVIDEYGGVSGLVTLEDVVEEIVGEIVDESDIFDPDVVRLKGKKWIVQGKTDIDDVNKILGLNISESNDYDTFSGYVLEKMGKIPETGEKLVIDKYTVTVKERDGNRIKTFVFKKE
ncbi:MAG: hemolysin family protein [Thermodesulfobacteriota bacterium]|nr:hemolysin family protein [Thermodesulfobacteriota bacterium]